MAGLVVLLLGTACGDSSTGPKSEVLDQENLLDGTLGGQGFGRYDNGSGDPDPSGTSFDWQTAQTFTAGVSGTLTRVKLPVRNLFGATEPVIVEIRAVVDGAPDTLDSGLLGSASLPAADFASVLNDDPSTWPSFDVSNLGIHLVQGHVYAFTARSVDPAGFLFNPESSMEYSGGEHFYKNAALGEAWNTNPDDLGFQIFVLGS